MSNSVSRFPESNASAVPATDSEDSNQSLSTSAEAALKLVIDNAAGTKEFRHAAASQASLRALQGPLDRIARQRVFEAIARKALENPSHPYYKAGPEARNEMIRAIADALDHSHYLKR
ncbi:MAG TPA: hypothetical protein VJP40_02350 [bacterium]|nr:hypothetical protein [bacterium]